MQAIVATDGVASKLAVAKVKVSLLKKKKTGVVGASAKLSYSKLARAYKTNIPHPTLTLIAGSTLEYYTTS